MKIKHTMITKQQFEKELDIIISNAIREDVGDGDHTSLSSIPSNAQGKANLLVKDKGIIAGVAFAKKAFTYFDEEAKQFKINPQGILTLREMEAQTGVSAKAMREAALSAADFDKRLGDIKKTGN